MGLLILLGFLILASAFFSMSETALTAVNRLKVKKLLDQGAFGSKALHELRENPNRMLSTILVGNNIVNIAAASLATFIVIRFFEQRSFEGSGIAVTITALMLTIVLLVFGEITPKTIAIKRAEKLSLFVAPVIRLLAIILAPVIEALNWVCKPIIKVLGGDTKAHVPFVTEEELELLLSASEEEGILEKNENKMIHSIFEFGNTVVKEVMVPRPDMFCVDVTMPMEEVLKAVIEEGRHSRVPVFEGSVDNIIGFIFAKDLLKVCVERKQTDLRSIMRPAIFVPETKKLDELMRQMQAARTHIAIVVDEYGNVAGLVCFEDLLEEIVGEIEDEFDIEEKKIEALADGSMLVDARQAVREVNEKLRTHIPEGDYDTIGGFVLSLIGRLPAVGDSINYEDMKIAVEKVAKHRITRIKISNLKQK